MSDDLLAGIDCGATKVMVQSGAYCSKTNKISPGSIYHELPYSDHPGWNFNFKPIDTPIMEFNEVFSRTLGLSSDVVMKEMYTFIDRSNDKLTLRPEGTAGIARAIIKV